MDGLTAFTESDVYIYSIRHMNMITLPFYNLNAVFITFTILLNYFQIISFRYISKANGFPLKNFALQNFEFLLCYRVINY